MGICFNQQVNLLFWELLYNMKSLLRKLVIPIFLEFL